MFDQVSIIDSINAAVLSFNSEDYNAFGVKLGQTFKTMYDATDNIAIIDQSEMEKIEAKFETNIIGNFQAVIVGLIKGIFNEDASASIKACVTNVDQGYKDMKDGVESLDKQSAASFLRSLFDFACMIKDIIGQISTCVELQIYGIKLITLAVGIKNPKALVFHIGNQIKVNGVDIYVNIMGAIEAWKSYSWFNFGRNIGEALAKIVVTDTIDGKYITSKEETQYWIDQFNLVFDQDLSMDLF